MVRLTSLIIALSASALLAETVELQVERVQLTAITRLEIDGKCLDVSLQGAESDTLSMGAIRLADGIEVRSKKEGALLRVWVESSRGPLPIGCQGTVTLAVPKGMDITIETVAGDIALEKVTATKVLLKSMSGSFDLRKSSAAATLKTVSGEIDVDSLEGELRVETVSGQTDIVGVSGPITLISVSGEQDVEGGKGTIVAKSVSGSIDIEDFEGRITAETVSGSIEGENVVATGECRFKTKSGAITWDFANLDSLSFDLETSSGHLEAASASDSKRLKIGSGSILVRGISSSGSQKYY